MVLFSSLLRLSTSSTTTCSYAFHYLSLYSFFLTYLTYSCSNYIYCFLVIMVDRGLALIICSSMSIFEVGVVVVVLVVVVVVVVVLMVVFVVVVVQLLVVVVIVLILGGSCGQ